MLPINAKQIPVLFQKARTFQSKGDLEQAMHVYRSILATNPKLAEVHFNLAQIAAQRSNWSDAFVALDQARVLKPKEPAIWSLWIDFAKAAQDAGQIAKITKLLPKSGLAKPVASQLMTRLGTTEDPEAEMKAQLKRNKKSPEAHVQYGAFLLKDGRIPEAVTLFKKAAKLAPKSAKLQYQLAGALRSARRDKEALRAYDAALKLDPGAPALLAEKAMLLQNLGQLDEARACLVQAIETEPNNGSLYLLYVSSGKIGGDDPVATKARALYEINRKDRHLAFAVAKLAEAEKENPFPYLQRGNSLSRDAFPYSFENDAKAATDVRTLFETRDAQAWDRIANQEPEPIFVTGMPRSGTTLVEQIIAAHSDVASAGEVGVLGRLLGDLKMPPDPKVLSSKYWKMLKDRYPGAKRITDKSIGTYVHIGFIKQLFPAAKIVVVSRDPRDNALSIYKNMFADGLHRYSNDLSDIARFMRLFEAQVAFWSEVSPDAFTTISYEELIADPETQSRRLIENVGLEWQEACLSFHQNTARVDTLSNVQVRQPIYASSVGAWRAYETELAPFIETYGPIR